MISPLSEFEERLKSLHSYFDGLSLLEGLVGDESLTADPIGKRFAALRVGGMTSTAVREFNYSAAIILLSASFESFVEEVLIFVLRELRGTFPDYNDMPASVRDAHLNLTVELMPRLEQTRFRGRVTAELLISRIYGCQNGAAPYELNEEAFLHRTSNFRQKTVNQCFSRCGIDDVCGVIARSGRLQAFLNHHSIDGGAFHILDDLADRRNEVAHGTVSATLSLELLHVYGEYIGVFASALSAAAWGSVAGLQVAMKGIPMGQPFAVYNDSIVCFVDRDIAVNVGDVLVATTDGGDRIGGPILRMEIEHVAFEALNVIDGRGVGMEVEFRAKPEYEYFLLRGDRSTQAVVSDGQMADDGEIVGSLVSSADASENSGGEEDV